MHARIGRQIKGPRHVEGFRRERVIMPGKPELSPLIILDAMQGDSITQPPSETAQQ
jgi:hypothetical protein